RRDRSIRRVRDRVAARPGPVVGAAAPPRQHRLPTEALDAKICDAARVERAEPDDVSLVVEDERPRLSDVALRGDEDVPGLHRTAGDPNVDARRTEVGPRHEMLRRGV